MESTELSSRPPSPLSRRQRSQRVDLLRRQIALMREYADGTGDRQHARWLLKEVVYRIWEQPQIPTPRLDKYSLWFEWSPRAYERLHGYTKGGKRPPIQGLRLEHVIPRGVLAEELLEKDIRTLAAFLDSHFRAVVITVDDDAQLNAAGVRNRMPDGWKLGDDPWVRYDKAGFHRADFVIPCEVRPELV